MKQNRGKIIGGIIGGGVAAVTYITGGIYALFPLAMTLEIVRAGADLGEMIEEAVNEADPCGAIRINTDQGGI